MLLLRCGCVLLLQGQGPETTHVTQRELYTAPKLKVKASGYLPASSQFEPRTFTTQVTPVLMVSYLLQQTLCFKYEMLSNQNTVNVLYSLTRNHVICTALLGGGDWRYATPRHISYFSESV